MNINDHVRVRLTEYGQRILKSYVDHEFRVIAGNKADAFASDADGFVKFSLWELMSIFGSHFHQAMQMSPFLDNEIVTT